MAEQGDKNAQFNMGLMYEKGINVPQDNQKAKDWYKKAAARGSHAANINLNYMFENVD
jgi:TPR repeat protein